MKPRRKLAPPMALALVLGSLTGCGLLGGSDGLHYEGGRLTLEVPDPVLEGESEEHWTQFERRFRDSIRFLDAHLSDERILDALRDANHAQEQLTLDRMLNMDQAWQDATDEASAQAQIDERTDAACNASLREFQARHPQFAEVLVTGRKGLVVCLTNRTSDYYQADEEWWRETYRESRGRKWYGQLEYDGSAGTYAVPVYTPIVDPNTRNVIGIAKGVVRELATPYAPNTSSGPGGSR